MNVVPRTGFEPVISALRGRCPRPLDDRGKPCYLLPGEDSNLGPPEPESGVLPTELPGKWGQSSKGRCPPAVHYRTARHPVKRRRPPTGPGATGDSHEHEVGRGGPVARLVAPRTCGFDGSSHRPRRTSLSRRR